MPPATLMPSTGCKAKQKKAVAMHPGAGRSPHLDKGTESPLSRPPPPPKISACSLSAEAPAQDAEERVPLASVEEQHLSATRAAAAAAACGAHSRAPPSFEGPRSSGSGPRQFGWESRETSPAAADDPFPKPRDADNKTPPPRPPRPPRPDKSPRPPASARAAGSKPRMALLWTAWTVRRVYEVSSARCVVDDGIEDFGDPDDLDLWWRAPLFRVVHLSLSQALSLSSLIFPQLSLAVLPGLGGTSGSLGCTPAPGPGMGRCDSGLCEKLKTVPPATAAWDRSGPRRSTRDV